MRTEKQIAGSRINGARSRGPVSEHGKAISSRNGIRHGLLCETVVLAEEAPERFIALLKVYKRDFRPRNSFEVSLVENMVVARWRLMRIWGAQKTSLDRDMQIQDQDLAPSVRVVPALKGTPDTSCPPEVLLRYEIALDRQYARAAKLLMQHRSLPIADPEPYYPDTLPGHVWPEPVEPESVEQNDAGGQAEAAEQVDADERIATAERPHAIDDPVGALEQNFGQASRSPRPSPEADPCSSRPLAASVNQELPTPAAGHAPGPPNFPASNRTQQVIENTGAENVVLQEPKPACRAAGAVEGGAPDHRGSDEVDRITFPTG